MGDNSATIAFGKEDIYQGFKTKVLKNDKGEVCDAYSIASGLDYPAVGPEHSYLNDIGRVKYVSVNDNEALNAFSHCQKLKESFPHLKVHMQAYGMKLAKQTQKDKVIVINLSVRGDKDVEYVINLQNRK